MAMGLLSWDEIGTDTLKTVAEDKR